MKVIAHHLHHSYIHQTIKRCVSSMEVSTFIQSFIAVIHIFFWISFNNLGLYNVVFNNKKVLVSFDPFSFYWTEILVLGTGSRVERIKPSVLALLKRKGIAVEVQDTVKVLIFFLTALMTRHTSSNSLKLLQLLWIFFPSLLFCSRTHVRPSTSWPVSEGWRLLVWSLRPSARRWRRYKNKCCYVNQNRTDFCRWSDDQLFNDPMPVRWLFSFFMNLPKEQTVWHTPLNNRYIFFFFSWGCSKQLLWSSDLSSELAQRRSKPCKHCSCIEILCFAIYS